jgi:hypothetical protein
VLSSFLAECSAAGTLLDHGRFLYGWVFLRFNLIVLPLGHSLFLAVCSAAGTLSLFLAKCSFAGAHFVAS